LKTKAFTLIELLVAIALTSVISITLFYFSLSSIKLIGRAADTAGSMQVARSVIARISSDVIGSCGADTGSGHLELILGNITYEFRENKVRRQEGSDIYYMTTEGEIKDLRFSYPSSKMVKIEMTPEIGGKYIIDVYARN